MNDWTKAHILELYNSKTIRALAVVEGGAFATFAKGVFDGTQPLTVDALKLWALLQAGVVVAFCIRHTLAGIELKLNGLVDPSTVKSIEAGAVTALIAELESKKPEVAIAIKAHLADNT